MNILEKVYSKSDQNKLAFNITYCLVFQNVRNILQELFILLTSDKEHKKVFQDIPVVVFHNGKSPKDHLVKAKLPNVEITGRSESYGEGNCQICELCNTDTFSTKACAKNFKILCGALNYNFQKVVYLLKCRICWEAPYVGKAETKFRARFNDYKSLHMSYRKKNVKYHSNCNWTRTRNHLVHKRRLNHLAKLAK